jgi:hypothetical protein
MFEASSGDVEATFMPRATPPRRCHHRILADTAGMRRHRRKKATPDINVTLRNLTNEVLLRARDAWPHDEVFKGENQDPWDLAGACLERLRMPGAVSLRLRPGEPIPMPARPDRNSIVQLGPTGVLAYALAWLAAYVRWEPLDAELTKYKEQLEDAFRSNSLALNGATKLAATLSTQASGRIDGNLLLKRAQVANEIRCLGEIEAYLRTCIAQHSDQDEFWRQPLESRKDHAIRTVRELLTLAPEFTDVRIAVLVDDGLGGSRRHQTDRIHKHLRNVRGKTRRRSSTRGMPKLWPDEAG